MTRDEYCIRNASDSFDEQTALRATAQLVSGTEVARRLGVTQPAVSQAVKRGARITEERHLKLKED